MTPRQIAFAQQYVTDHNGAAAAVRAGYAANSSRVTASQLLAKPNVRALVAEHEAAMAERLGVSRERVIAELMDAVEVARAERDAGAMVRAWVEVAKMCGFSAPERAINLHVNVATKCLITELETRSDAELAKMVGEGDCQN